MAAQLTVDFDPASDDATAGGDGCGACGLDPCGCPETEAAIAALLPELGDAGCQAPAAPAAPFAPIAFAPPAADRAAAAFLDRRAALEAEHGAEACCHPARDRLCLLIDAAGRIDLLKSLLRNGEHDRALRHIVTIGAMMTGLHEQVSGSTSPRSGEGRA